MTLFIANNVQLFLRVWVVLLFGVVSWWLQPSVEQCSARTAISKWRLKDPGVALWWWRNREVQQGPARVSRDTPQNLTRHTSHVTRHTSHVTPHTSHLTPHTSHLTPHTSHNPHPPPAPPSPPHKRRVRMARASPSGPRCRSCTPPLPSSSASRPLGHVDHLQRARRASSGLRPTPNESANRQLRCSANGTHSTATHASTATLGACTFCCQAVEKAAQGHVKHGVKTGRMAGMQLAVAEQGWHHGCHGAASQFSHGCARLRHAHGCAMVRPTPTVGVS